MLFDATKCRWRHNGVEQRHRGSSRAAGPHSSTAAARRCVQIRRGLIAVPRTRVVRAIASRIPRDDVVRAGVESPLEILLLRDVRVPTAVNFPRPNRPFCQRSRSMDCVYGTSTPREPFPAHALFMANETGRSPCTLQLHSSNITDSIYETFALLFLLMSYTRILTTDNFRCPN